LKNEFCLTNINANNSNKCTAYTISKENFNYLYKFNVIYILLKLTHNIVMQFFFSSVFIFFSYFIEYI